MSVALRGNLTDFGIADVFQLIGQQRKTGFLDVTTDGTTMRLAFDAGGVVWACPSGSAPGAVLGERLVRCGLLTQREFDELSRASEASARPISVLAVEAGGVSREDVEQIEELITDETIFVVLRCTSGSFDFSAKAVNHHRPREKLLAAEQILMDGLRKVDEWQTFSALVPSGETVFEPSGRTDGLAAPGKRERIVFGLVDGRLTAQRIIDLSRLGLFDATRALAELHHSGWIRPLSEGQTRMRSRKRDGSFRPVVETARWWLAAAFPVALLSLVVSMILQPTPTVDGPRVFPIVRAPLEQARAAFEKRRLRHVVEAEHMLSGRWPTQLEAADMASVGGALTPPDVGDYYYARRGNGIILLAPEHHPE
jgi:hypothetical protein